MGRLAGGQPQGRGGLNAVSSAQAAALQREGRTFGEESAERRQGRHEGATVTLILLLQLTADCRLLLSTSPSRHQCMLDVLHEPLAPHDALCITRTWSTSSLPFAFLRQGASPSPQRGGLCEAHIIKLRLS